MERFAIEQVYGMHNWSGVPVGSFAIRAGPIMAATDPIEINIEGRGGHSSRPDKCIDSVFAGAQFITSLQQIVARNVDPFDSAVISISEFHTGANPGVIPHAVALRGNIRALTPETREFLGRRVREVGASIAQMTGAKIEVKDNGGIPRYRQLPRPNRTCKTRCQTDNGRSKCT